MGKLNLLFITKDHEHNLEKSSYYLSCELSKHLNLILWNGNGTLQEILNYIRVKPDFILFNDFKPDYCPFVRNIRSVDIPVGIIMHDLYYKKARRKQLVQNENIGHIFSIYRDSFLEWFPEFKDRMIWFPHHVPLDVFQDYGLPAEIDNLMVGSIIPRLYPLRNKMLMRFKGTKGFVYYPHPGYGKVNGHSMTGINYAQLINRSKMVLTCDSIYHFPVLKYFEVAACNRLLLAPESKELNDLGFVDGETFAAVNENNFSEKADYYLHHEEERKQIAKNGYEMVRRRHSTHQRTVELIRKIEEIVGGHYSG